LIVYAGPNKEQQQQQHLQLSLSSDKLSQYGASFANLTVDIMTETEARLHVKIRPTGKKRWEVPESLVPRWVYQHIRLLLLLLLLLCLRFLRQAWCLLLSGSLMVDEPRAEARGGSQAARPFALTVTR
jgi:hypothetical protein